MRDLALADRGLNGFIPSALADLTGLRRLDLDNNTLSGSLPPSARKPHEPAAGLRLGERTLSGPLPPQWAALPNLRFLFLNGNDLSGTLPPDWGGMTVRCEQLVLDGNALSGGIPAAWGGMAALEDLFLRDNALSGSIPPELENLGSLEDLYLEGNAFTGCIPVGPAGHRGARPGDAGAAVLRAGTARASVVPVQADRPGRLSCVTKPDDE